MLSKLFLLLVLVALSTLARAEDWPQFRGPTGQGHAASTRLPLEWSATKNVAWKQVLPGKGWSSPVLVQRRLYLTTAVAPGAGSADATLKLQALCLDEKNGQTLWTTTLFTPDAGTAPKGHGKNSQASPTPLIEDGRLYVHFGHLGTACLDLDGKILWKNNSIHYPPVHGNGGSPVLAGDALIFSCDGASDPFIVALHKDTGKELWRTARDTPAKKQFSFSSPLLLTEAGRQQIISPASGRVCAYDPKTGKELWHARYGEGYSVIPRPVFGHGLIFVSSGYDRAVVHAIRTGGKGDVTDTHTAWTLAKGAPNTPSLLLVGDELYMVSDGGIASCVDARTGAVHWSERVGGDYSASPLHANGRIYFQNETGTTVVVKAGKTFEKLATNDLGEKTLASPAAGDAALYLRTEKHLYKIKGS